MRPNVTRRRMTFNDSVKWAEGRRYFGIRTEPVITADSLGQTAWALCLLTVGAALLLIAASLLPVDHWVFTRVYLPLLGLLAGPWIFKILGLPPGLFMFAAFTAFLILASHVVPSFSPTEDQHVLGIGVLIAFGPLVAWTWAGLISVADVWRVLPWTLGAVVLLGCAAATAILPREAVPMWDIGYPIGVGAALCGVKVAQLNAGLLSTSHNVPFRASYFLIDLSEDFWGAPYKHRCIFSWWVAHVTSVVGATVTVVLYMHWSMNEPEGRATLPPALLFQLVGSVALGPLLAGLTRGGQGPAAYLLRLLSGATRFAVAWHADDHPAPNVPGIWSLSQFAPRSARLGITFALLALATWGGMIQRPSLGAGRFRDLLHQQPLSGLQSALSLAGTALLALVVGLLLIGGPWFAHAAAIVAAERKAEGDNASSL